MDYVGDVVIGNAAVEIGVKRIGVESTVHPEIIYHFRPGVVAQHRESPAEALLEVELQGVVMGVVERPVKTHGTKVGVESPRLSVLFGRQRAARRFSGNIKGGIGLVRAAVHSRGEVSPFIAKIGRAQKPVISEFSFYRQVPGGELGHFPIELKSPVNGHRKRKRSVRTRQGGAVLLRKGIRNALAAKRVDEADVTAKIEPWPEGGCVYKTVRANRRGRRIVKARSAPHHRLRVQLIGESQTRREIAEIAVRTERWRTTWIVVG